jgi:carboxyl-terminal processing protease
MRSKGLWTGLVVGLLIGMTLGSSLAAPAVDRAEGIRKGFFEPLAWVVARVERFYVDDVDLEPLFEGAAQGMLSKLDPHSVYMPAEMFKEFTEGTKGEFGGLGIHIRFLPLKKVVLVENPIPGTPAFNEGVLAGDWIIEVREESTGKVTKTSEFDTVQDAVKLLRGKPGSLVTITIIHGEGGKPREITVRRAIVKVPGVRGQQIVDLDHKIGYVYVPQFHKRMVADLQKVMASEGFADINGLVIDMRFNPGGLLTGAREMADMFLDEQSVVVSTRGRASPERVLKATSEQKWPRLKIAVLVNRSSASAAEIVAAALQDHGRAIIVGEASYGKASVQNLFKFPNGKGGIKLTIARYYTPKGTLIHEKGVQPDFKLRLENEDYRRLARHIGKLASDFGEKKEPNEDEPKVEEPKAEPDDKDAEPEKPFVDEQLKLALKELVKIIEGNAVVETVE